MKLDGINPAINEDLFFKKLIDDVVKLKVVEISEVKKSDYVKGSFYITIGFKILENIKGFNKNDIVDINFTLSDKTNNEYRIKHNTKLYPLLNYAYILAGVVPKGNQQGIIVTEEEIKEALTDLEFVGMPDIETPKFKKPYNILKVLA